MNNIQSISDAYLCSNCGACSAVCPKEAISFESTSIGRMYAKVDSKCIDCGLCVKVCPSVEPPAMDNVSDRYVGNIISVNVGRSTDDAIYHNAQSGGACTAILTYLFDTGAIDCAIVCRMSFGNPPVVESVLITDKDDLKACQKSCYTPVEILSKLRSAKRYKSVAVVGLPCHIQGLTKILQDTNLFKNVNYKLGLVCDRTLCGSIQNVMLSYVPDGEYKIDWRRKDFTYEGVYHPYKDAPVTVYKKTTGGGKVFSNVYRFALKDMFTSPRCRVCFDKVCVFADIVLGDPWRMTEVDEEYRIFMANERKSKEQITSIARKIILKHLAKLRLKCSIAYKAMRKVYRLVKRIFKR